jgi:hypothetical protein
MNYSSQEILHYCLLWIYNFHEGDLQAAHEKYSCGADYHWNKYLGKRDQEVNATQAMTEVILNMDTEGQELLINWILKDSKDLIVQQREWKEIIATHEKSESKHD